MGRQDYEIFVRVSYFGFSFGGTRRFRDGRRIKVTNLSLPGRVDDHRYVIERRGDIVVVIEEKKASRVGRSRSRWETIDKTEEILSLKDISMQHLERRSDLGRKKVEITSRRRQK